MARLLTAHRIKRVPVLRNGRIAGIVSRADLVRALAEDGTEATGKTKGTAGLLAQAMAGFERRFLDRPHETDPTRPAARPLKSDETATIAADFRRLAADHENLEALHQEEYRRAAAQQRSHRLAELVNHHILDEDWRGLVHKARQAAERGEKEFLLLHFPSQLCSDAGRAINMNEPQWAATLRGEAVEICRLWERDLKPNGFRLVARVLDFPDGLPGDIGLFLSWEQ